MAENKSGNDAASRLGSLADMVKQSAGKGHPPVEDWNPPYCGDIGLAILADGTWTYRGSPISRPALVKLFANVLRKDADGKTYLVTPKEKVDVAVADAPFLAVEMKFLGIRHTKNSSSARTWMMSSHAALSIRCGSRSTNTPGR